MIAETKQDTTPRISSNPFPALTVHGGGTGWKIRMIDVRQLYPYKPPRENELHYLLQELTSETYECKADAVTYMQTLEHLRQLPGASLVYEDVIKYAFTTVHKETFQAS